MKTFKIVIDGQEYIREGYDRLAVLVPLLNELGLRYEYANFKIEEFNG